MSTRRRLNPSRLRKPELPFWPWPLLTCLHDTPDGRKTLFVRNARRLRTANATVGSADDLTAAEAPPLVFRGGYDDSHIEPGRRAAREHRRKTDTRCGPRGWRARTVRRRIG